MKKALSLLLTLLMLCTALCAAAEGEPEKAPETWAVYLYMCATDLESGGWCATDNLNALIGTPLPENVTFVLETGAAAEWHNGLMNPEYLERWTLKNTDGRNAINLIEQLPSAPMSDADTLESFLRFAHDGYPADHTMVLIWDHGGGTVGGVCYDELYKGNGTLPLTGLRAACENVFGADPEHPPIDIIGFDCCLMATVDTAAMMQGCARYMLASEETIPGYGWDYTEFANAFADRPDIGPEDLGRQICADYLRQYEVLGISSAVTLSLTDLNKLGPVLDAYDRLGLVLLDTLYTHPDNYTGIAVAADAAENYGGNSRTTGYCNMVDLYDFAFEYAAQLVIPAMDLCTAIDDCVLCSVYGDYRKNSHGLSFYFPYDGNMEKLNRLDVQGCGNAFKCLYSVARGKELSDEERAFMAGTTYDPDAQPVINTFKSIESPDKRVKKDRYGNYYAAFGPETGASAVNALTRLFLYGEDGSDCLLGTDDELEAHFDKGLFINSFSGEWLAMGDMLVHVNLEFDSNDYNLYSIPITYHGANCFMQVGYSFTKKEWQLMGVRHENDDPGKVRPFMIEDGEVIGIRQQFLDEEEGYYVYQVVGEVEYRNGMIRRVALPDGRYGMQFMLEDAFRDILFSDEFAFTVTNGVLTWQ